MTGAPEETASRSVRLALLLAIIDAVTGWNLTQVQAAERLGITQPRLNDLLRGRADKFSLEMLVRLSVRAGLTIHLDIGDAT